ncbi:hypothetical protein ElyMa_001383500 [Elysia marginata]|uniref:Uncharacterized protein n=1 Tax=Elysia marginata TaxID=1093978 RepID=A0AAV4IUE0_9GAST|nr:hypothetical protein ElyMa_001383500 [Elysia marginata]
MGNKSFRKSYGANLEENKCDQRGFTRYGPARDDETHSGENPRWLMAYGALGQSSAVKPTLPMGVVTSYVIVIGEKGLLTVRL